MSSYLRPQVLSLCPVLECLLMGEVGFEEMKRNASDMVAADWDLRGGNTHYERRVRIYIMDA